MNNSKPKESRNRMHSNHDNIIDAVVLCRPKALLTDIKRRDISWPVEYKHTVNATCDHTTGNIVMRFPKVETSFDDDNYMNYDCNNSNELYFKWNRDQLKIKELQDENNFMHAMVARLCLCKGNADINSAIQNEWRNALNGNVKIKKFTDNITSIANALALTCNDRLLCDHSTKNMNQTIIEMRRKIFMLQKQLKECCQDKDKAIFQADLKIFGTEQKLESMKKEANMLKSRLIELEEENDSFRQNVNNLFTKWHAKSSRVSSTFNEGMPVLELNEEGHELFKRGLPQLYSDRNQLNEETTTMCQIPTVQVNLEFEESDITENVDCGKQHIPSSTQNNYNIKAAEVHFFDKSNIKYTQTEGETTESLEEFYI